MASLQRADDLVDRAFLIARDGRDDWRWWTWAGAKANRTLAAWAPDLVPPRQRIGAELLRLHSDLSVEDTRGRLAVLRALEGERPLPHVDKNALKGPKFSAALPEALARRTLSARTVDEAAAETVLHEKTQIVTHPAP